MTTLSGEITIIDVADGKNYVLNIVGGTRSIVYDKDGKNPLPVATDFDYELLEDGKAVSPQSVSWTTSGRMTGSGTGKLFRPTYTANIGDGTGGSAVLLDVVYKGLILKAVAPISISQVGATGSTGDKGEAGPPGKDGVGIVSIKEQYQLSNSMTGVTAGGDDWLDKPQVPSKKLKYLWNYEIITYTDGRVIETDPAIIGMYSEDGRSITGISEKYMATDKASGVVNDAGTWYDEVQPLTPTNKYLWNYEIITYDKEPFTQKTKASMIGVYGDKGDTGDKGETGDEGRGVASIQEYYAINNTTTPPTDWKTTLQIPTATNRYLWNYEVITYTKGSPLTKSTVPAIIGMYSEDGTSLDKIVEKYLVSSSKTGIVNTAGAWQDTPPPTTATNRYLWNYEEITYVGPALPGGVKIEKTPPAIIGVYGDKGDKGDSAPHLTTQYSANSSGSNPSSTFRPTDKYMRTYNGATYSAWMKIVGEDGSDGAYTNFEFAKGTLTAAGTVWQDSPPVIGVNEHVWMRKAQVDKSGSQGAWSTPIRLTGDKGDKGDEGTGVKSAVVAYRNHTSGTATPPTTGWDENPPTPIKGQYMWTRTITTYTDNSNITTYSVAYNAIDGGDGKGITSTTVSYAISTSGSTTPTNWLPTRPTPDQGDYMWTRTVIKYTDGTESTAYNTSYSATDGQKGDKGDKGETGKGIKSQVVTYQNHSNGTTAPTGTWSDTPSPVKGQYLWTRTVTQYTEGNPITTYAVAYNALDGQKGATGDKGTDGTGISSTVIRYFQSTSGTTTPTGDGATTPPTPIQGQYNWTRTVITYTDGTKSTAWSTSYNAKDGKKGDTGDRGPQGVPGQPGAKGETTYVWIAYADNASGGGISKSPTSKKYVGYASGQTNPTVSITNPDLFTWQLVKGEDGTPGIPGEPGKDGKPVYTWIKYADTPTSGMDDSPTGKKYIGMAFNKPTTTESTSYSAYQWSLMPQNIEIGGRNLLHNTSSEWIEVVQGTGWYTQFANPEVILEVGETYTFSVIIEKISDDNVPINVSLGTGTTTYQRDIAGWRVSNITFGEKVVLTKTITESDLGTHTGIFAWRIRNEQQPTTVRYKEVKLEKGNIATDWTPAPEDVQAKIDENKILKSGTPPPSPIENQLWLDISKEPHELNVYMAGEWRFVGTDLEDMDERITTVTTEMGTLSTEISARVLQTEYDENYQEVSKNYTEFKQEYDSFTAGIQVGGGNNLIKNSVGYGDLNYWNVINDGDYTLGTSTWILKGVSNHGLIFSNFEIEQDLKLESNKEYTISGKLQKNTPAGIINISLNDNQGLVHEVINLTTETYEGQFSLEFNSEINTDLTLNIKGLDLSTVEPSQLTDLFLVQGKNNEVWSQANGEVYTLNVKVDGEGITVYDSNGKGKTVMSPEEFAGYYNNEQVFTVNRDITEVMGLLVKEQGLFIPPVKMVQNGNVSLDIVWTGGI